MDDTPTVEQRAERLVRRIEEEVTSAYSEFGRRILMHPASVPYLQKCVLWYVGEHFDIHAKWYLFEISKYEQIQSQYGPLLVEVATQAVKRFEAMREDWPNLARVGVHGTMQVLLQSRIEHWKAAAFKKIREIEEDGLSKPSSSVNQAEPPRRTARQYREPNSELLKDADSTLNRSRAADALGVSVRTLDRWVEDKKLTPVGVGARKRFKVKELKKMADQRNLDKRDKK